jgi:hypothetical protein
MRGREGERESAGVLCSSMERSHRREEVVVPVYAHQHHHQHQGGPEPDIEDGYWLGGQGKVECPHHGERPEPRGHLNKSSLVLSSSDL